MIKLDVSDLLKRKITTKQLNIFVKEDELFKENDEVKLSEPLEVDGYFKVLEDVMFLNAKATGNLIVTCSRCLQEFNVPISLQFEEKFSSTNEEDDISKIENEKIDITALLEDNILLTLPIKKLCNDSCKGLCQKCGANLNLNKCNCDNDVVDLRLEKLKELFPNI